MSKNLEIFRDAMLAETLTRTQGSDYQAKVVPFNEVYSFLLNKMGNLKNSLSEFETFEYLNGQCVNTDRDVLESFKSRLKISFKNCSMMNHYSQLKIPCTTIRPMRSDANNNKRCGTITLQFWLISMLMDAADDSHELYRVIDEYLETHRGDVGSHLCKKVCSTRGHVIPTKSIVNIKTHDSCPAFWVVNQKLYSLCICDGNKDLVDLSQYRASQLIDKLGNRCLRPGPHFVASVYSSFIASILQNQ